MSKSVNINRSSYQNLLDLVQAANPTQPIGNFTPAKITAPIPTASGAAVSIVLTAGPSSEYKDGSTATITYNRLDLAAVKTSKAATFTGSYVLVDSDTVASLLAKIESDLGLLVGDCSLVTAADAVFTDAALATAKDPTPGDDGDDGIVDTVSTPIKIKANTSSFVYHGTAEITLIETVKAVKPTLDTAITTNVVGDFTV